MMAGPRTRGAIIPIEGSGQPVWFEWNPAQVDGPTVKAEWPEIKTAGREVPFLQYSNGSTITYKFELDVSRSDNGDDYVQGVVDGLVAMTRPSVRGEGINRPPRVIFMFGALFRKTCVVVEVSPSYRGLFNPITLQPYQATISVLLNEYRG